MFFVYAIFNDTHNKLYIGQTENLNRRILEHNDPKNKRHSFTKRFSGTWRLIYSEPVLTRTDAIKREKQLKSYQGRLFVRRHIG